MSFNIFNLSGFGLKCYFCSPQQAILKGKSFTPQQCKQNQTEVTCAPTFDRCIKAHQKKKIKDDHYIEHEMRDCSSEKTCDLFQKVFDQAEMLGWDYELECCQTDLCNSGDIFISKGLTWPIFSLSTSLALLAK